MKRYGMRIGLCCLILLWSGSMALAEVQPLPLTGEDCIKCHFDEVKAIHSQESAHKNEITCLDCHEGHPPEGEAVIPECSNCHDPADNPHFATPDCTNCHQPHAPIVTDFDSLGEAKPVCVTCHTDINRQMEEIPSAHSEQDCTACHHQHGLAEGQSDTCTDCHEKHAPELTREDCLRCHRPHQPNRYIWDQEIAPELCGACHGDLVKTFAENGAAHQENLACTDCHQAHPPREENVIPSCAQCHDPGEKAHFAMKNCTGCHNPHEPKKIDFSGVKSVRPVCLSCHPQIGKDMKKHPSAHAKQECNQCHRIHGQHLSCLDCHEGHDDSMQYGDCLKCHRPHYPMPPTFANKVQPKLCGACHETEYTAQKSDTKSKHGKLQCVYCHTSRHKVIRKCRTCHGEPHDAPLHRNFPDCHKCHGNPHHLKK